MRVTERLPPVAAALSALATLACCLPLGIAGAVEEVLSKHPESSLVVLAVWEPILPTDWSAPGAMALKRLHDRRVRQFWDPNHLIAAAIKKVEVSGAVHPGLL